MNRSQISPDQNSRQRKRSRLKKIRQRATLASAAGVKSSRSPTKRAFSAASLGRGMIKSTCDLRISVQHRKHISTAKALPEPLCDKPASCKAEYLHVKTHSRKQPQCLSNKFLDCYIAAWFSSDSLLEPQKKSSSFLFSFVSPRKGLSPLVLDVTNLFLERSGGPATHLSSEKRNLHFCFLESNIFLLWGLAGRHYSYKHKAFPNATETNGGATRSPSTDLYASGIPALPSLLRTF